MMGDAIVCESVTRSTWRIQDFVTPLHPTDEGLKVGVSGRHPGSGPDLDCSQSLRASPQCRAATTC
jgi:hypothetical protein